MSHIPKPTIWSLYRTFRRQINLLPSEYLRQFFRIKLADDVRNVLAASNGDARLQRTKFKRVQRDLRKIGAAHAGDNKAYAHILDLAYGRKGKLRWEIMEPLFTAPDAPLFTAPDAPLPDRIIHNLESSRPPVYSPEYKALLTSGISRPAKALKPENFSHPHTLPGRADPQSEEARLLGPFSKRREVNIRWRFFKNQRTKTYPPLQVAIVEKPSTPNSEPIIKTDKASLDEVGVRAVGLQGSGVWEDLVAAAGPPVYPPPQTRRERAASAGDDRKDGTRPGSASLPRFIRRRLQDLLGRTPLLTYHHKPGYTPSKAGKYMVSLAPNAPDPSRYGAKRLPEAHESYLAWLDKGPEEAHTSESE